MTRVGRVKPPVAMAAAHGNITLIPNHEAQRRALLKGSYQMQGQVHAGDTAGVAPENMCVDLTTVWKKNGSGGTSPSTS
eukprot:CAMPEP_0206492998 /NCGR_PEP_ID=MMETSP0324_2-20121206/46586_1 /ASSEMBLY_ACC=CAM_ASM_000836 /TAXON_ID=2866 /ORGANISM="Crypthecodinium cohnii, Strain Seligo" /LENGTH=78 /DNA_ID=CAMNT_0053975809 /DNA_START=275 /DNA_END=507 /DNA_ORIENTATION=+